MFCQTGLNVIAHIFPYVTMHKHIQRLCIKLFICVVFMVHFKSKEFFSG